MTKKKETYKCPFCTEEIPITKEKIKGHLIMAQNKEGKYLKHIHITQDGKYLNKFIVEAMINLLISENLFDDFLDSWRDLIEERDRRLRVVYCSKCENYSNVYGECNVEENKKEVITWWDKSTELIQEPKDKNKDNHCKDYKEIQKPEPGTKIGCSIAPMGFWRIFFSKRRGRKC